MVLTYGRPAAALVSGRVLQQQLKHRQQLSLPASQTTRALFTVVEKYLEASKRFGLKQTLWKLYNPGDVKFGRCVGQDENGFKYYEDPTELYGQDRWTEYQVDSWDEVEGTLIPPPWHLWMHHLTDAVPGEAGQDAQTWAKRPVVAHSDAPFTNHVGESGPYSPNKTLYRSRGYNVGSVAIPPGEPDQYYLQPGHLRRKRKHEQHFFAEVDYNNPEMSDESRQQSLRPADVN
ncbi:unnamed protein product [Hyaloperonospora brassicae]|uniref:NADH dehydrogenase [ubiquinone] 1 alpha subcomplex subunit 12 n=1 Tax=Hyaloperonospora brassicae TaxID=162125 RepID=A0AAV0V2J0_HYABA|nr:unnamed protein product [Hyaloperonospora brassicae]